MNPSFTNALQQIAIQAPLLLTCMVGICVALAFWSKNAQAALLVVLGCGIMLLTPLVFAVIYYQVGQNYRGGNNIQVVYQGLGLIRSLFGALAVGLLISAAFVGRKSAEPQTFYLPSKPA